MAPPKDLIARMIGDEFLRELGQDTTASKWYLNKPMPVDKPKGKIESYRTRPGTEMTDDFLKMIGQVSEIKYRTP